MERKTVSEAEQALTGKEPISVETANQVRYISDASDTVNLQAVAGT